MLKAALPVTAETIAQATWRARRINEQVLKSAAALTEDPQQIARVAAQLCTCCFYIQTARIGGAAVTTQPCGLCQTPEVYASTATDLLCLPCARARRLCKRCGAQITLPASTMATRA